jgi:Domain of unknown function (DUF4384)
MLATRGRSKKGRNIHIMLRVGGVTTTLAIVFTAAAAPAQQANPQPTARELFYQAASPPAKTVKAAKAAAPPKNTTPSTGSTTVATSPKNSGPPAGASDAYRAPIIKASGETAAPLGLRYSIVRLVNGHMVEVSPDFVFHAGDHIQLRVQANTPGYLYVVNQGSSGAWTPLFPSPKIADGDNRVDGFHTYILPTPEYQMSFDEHTGTENVTIVFSRQPVPDFEELIYSLQGHQAKPASQPQPGEQPVAAPKPKGVVMMASVHIDDNIVGRLRNSSTRDLIVEHVDSATPADSSSADKKETAVYVVNPAGTPDSRLVADLHLVHQ